jgi:hypothetical protein
MRTILPFDTSFCHEEFNIDIILKLTSFFICSFVQYTYALANLVDNNATVFNLSSTAPH